MYSVFPLIIHVYCIIIILLYFCIYRYYEMYQQKIINLLENKQFSEEELQLVTTLTQTGLDNELKRYKDS